MKDNLIAIFALVDGSGSMKTIRKGVIDGFNEFVSSQRAVEGEAVFSMVQFNTTYGSEMIYNKLYDFRNVKTVEPLTEKTYTPAGGTPLLDAMGRSIMEFGQQLAALPEKDRPGKVVFLVMTDGEENSSHKFTREQIKSMIQHQESVYDWQFVYTGANQDSFTEAGLYGFKAQSTANYQHTYAGSSGMLRTLSASVTSYRAGDTKNVILTDLNDSEEDKKNGVRKPAI